MTWTIRTAGAADAPACFAVYVDAIRGGTGGKYTRRQALAWAPEGDAGDWLAARLECGVTWIAVSERRAEGFLNVTPLGHLDLFFIRPEARASGLAAALHDRLMAWAQARALPRLTTDASHLARSFLEKHGWRVLGGESVERGGVALKRWKMEWCRMR